MDLNPQSVAAHKEILLNPAKYNMPYRPLTDCFEKSEQVTANHILFKEFTEHEFPRLQKIFFYIIMEELYGSPNGKDSNGNLGYHLVFKPTPPAGE